MTRSGNCMGNVESLRRHLSEDEWGFWYEGRAARRAIPDNFGNSVFAAGKVRAGGSHAERMAGITSWNTVMDEHNYLVRRWEHLAGRIARPLGPERA